jgi:trans-aconitate 2-methyltransferase
MTEWDARDYARISGLQQAMAKEVLSLLSLRGSEQVLDVGCGNGHITAEIAERVPQGSVIGVDPSSEMIAFANHHFCTAGRSNLRFQVADACRLPFRDEFDLVVSFNALHWIPEPKQEEALRSLCAAMKPEALGHLRLVPAGKRKSLENVIEETRLSSRWSGYFQNVYDPYLHLTPEQYGALAERNGLRVLRLEMTDKAWDFGSRAAFQAFAAVTFVEWTQHLPDLERSAFVNDVLDRYRIVAEDRPGEENTFKFYQMDVTLARADGARASTSASTTAEIVI